MTWRSVLAGCWFGHSTEWTRVIVDGVWFRQCERCQQPTAAILVNAEASDIQPAKVKAIKALKAKKVKRPKLAAVSTMQRRA
jgi:hypothetical protein